MKLLLENWRKHLNELIGPPPPGVGLGFGGLSPGHAGTFTSNRGGSFVPHKATKEVPSNEDAYITVKVCMHRNSMVLLLKNEKGWDLPGGHLKLGEDPVDGLKREVFEETGISISDIVAVGPPTEKKKFFCAAFLTDDIHLSNEHYEYKFFHVDEIKNLNELSEEFKSVILKCLGEEKTGKAAEIKKIKISIGVRR
jgi:hypothetical protein